jgi:hypothetical protein
MAEKTEDWQRDETGLRQARNLFHPCIPISGSGSAESQWGSSLRGFGSRSGRLVDSWGVGRKAGTRARRGETETPRGAARDGESWELQRVREDGAEKRKKEPSVRDDWCLPISAASRK